MGPCLQDAVLLELLYLILGCFTSLPTSCCLVRSLYQIFAFRSFWCRLHGAKLFDLGTAWPLISMSCYLLYLLQIRFFSFMVLRCMMLPASCYPASHSLPHVKLLHAPCIRSSCLILSLGCYAAWPSLPRATSFKSCRFISQHDITRLDLVSIILLCWVFTASFYAVWSSLPHASLLDLNSFMSFGFRTGWHKSCMLFDLGFMRLGCWILSFSCYAAWSSLPSCYAAWSSFNHVWFGLHGATLLDGLYLMLRCWTFPAICYASGWPLFHVMIIDLAINALRCLISSKVVLRSWTWLVFLRRVLSTMSVFPKLVVMMPSLPLVTLLALVLSSWCDAAW